MGTEIQENGCFASRDGHHPVTPNGGCGSPALLSAAHLFRSSLAKSALDILLGSSVGREGVAAGGVWATPFSALGAELLWRCRERGTIASWVLPLPRLWKKRETGHVQRYDPELLQILNSEKVCSKCHPNTANVIQTLTPEPTRKGKTSEHLHTGHSLHLVHFPHDIAEDTHCILCLVSCTLSARAHARTMFRVPFFKEDTRVHKLLPSHHTTPFLRLHPSMQNKGLNHTRLQLCTLLYTWHTHAP